MSKKELKKIPKNDDKLDARQLLLDENEIQKVENIDSYPKVEKVRNIIYTLQRPVTVI